MAEGGTSDPLTNHKVWTFVIRGGEPFELSLPRTPKLEHDGRLTVWKMVGTGRVAGSVKTLLETTEALVEVHAEDQTPEQTAERRKLLGIGEVEYADL